ncbi:hypothetical protein F7Q99_20475 [Streptomyces kaniharaensis]|uniref:Uncharacterized protein n=1 Tax=Streptomyces kaniharaensis TaxID=212423 RepID=A0A6N7KSK0_9ACTN|nr:hypothetical protein [Streptomyces kaniharaensis]MQS14576.1 hypothetical protein [Streptomyces kaniharaensis]
MREKSEGSTSHAPVGKAAASASSVDGREDVFMGPVAIYTRLRCEACYRADPLHGTFAGDRS